MKAIKKSHRIPTLLALTLLAIALGLGIWLNYYQQQLKSQIRSAYTPKKLSVTNTTDTSTTITWQTDTPTIGQIIYSPSSALDQKQPDLRDLKGQPTPRLSHFVVLNNLSPNLTYNYKVVSQQETYPQNFLIFKTGPVLNLLSQNTPQPLRGSVVDTFSKPLDDALVFLDINGASRLTTFTNSAGNFILPLKDLRTKDLSKPFDLSQAKEAQLIILQGQQTSTYQIALPPPNQSLDSLVLGQNLDLKQFQPPSLPEEPLTSTPSASLAPINKYDLNGDGKINAIDLTILSQAINKKPINKKADLNSDGVVDKKDLDLLKSKL